MMETIAERVEESTNDEVLVKFGKVAFSVPKVNVGAGVGEGSGRVADRTTVLFEKKDAVVDVIAVVHGNVAIDRFRAPKLRRHVDNKGMGNRTKRKMVVKIGNAGGRQGGERHSHERVDVSRRKRWKSSEDRDRGKRRRVIVLVSDEEGAKRNERRDFLSARNEERRRDEFERVSGTSKKFGVGEYGGSGS
jgi:hypothetical protein